MVRARCPLDPGGCELDSRFPLPSGLGLCQSLSATFPFFLANVPLHPILFVRNNHCSFKLISRSQIEVEVNVYLVEP